MDYYNSLKQELQERGQHSALRILQRLENKGLFTRGLLASIAEDFVLDRVNWALARAYYLLSESQETDAQLYIKLYSALYTRIQATLRAIRLIGLMSPSMLEEVVQDAPEEKVEVYLQSLYHPKVQEKEGDLWVPDTLNTLIMLDLLLSRVTFGEIEAIQEAASLLERVPVPSQVERLKEELRREREKREQLERELIRLRRIANNGV